MNCETCGDTFKIVWKINKSIAPNRYRKKKTELSRESKQKSLFCEKCNYIKNNHNLLLKDIFGDYKYRSPKNNSDIQIVKYLKKFCKLNSIKSIVEIGGNNAVFAKKLISNLNKINEYLLYDKVPFKKSNNILFHKNEYISSKTKFKQTDLIIARHVFAHNRSIKKFATNIYKKFNPKYIYIECANWNLTYKNLDFGQLYSEHFYALSPYSVFKLFCDYKYGLKGLSNFDIHNGSFGLILGKNSTKTISRRQKINFSKVRLKIMSWNKKTKSIWQKASKNNIIIWGASAKIIFMINALNLSINKVKFIHDSTNVKQNLYPPGINTSVSAEPKKINYDYFNVVVGAKNFQKIIIPKIKYFYPNSKIYLI